MCTTRRGRIVVRRQLERRVAVRRFLLGVLDKVVGARAHLLRRAAHRRVRPSDLSMRARLAGFVIWAPSHAGSRRPGRGSHRDETRSGMDTSWDLASSRRADSQPANLVAQAVSVPRNPVAKRKLFVTSIPKF